MGCKERSMTPTHPFDDDPPASNPTSEATEPSAVTPSADVAPELHEDAR